MLRSDLFNVADCSVTASNWYVNDGYLPHINFPRLFSCFRLECGLAHGVWGHSPWDRDLETGVLTLSTRVSFAAFFLSCISTVLFAQDYVVPITANSPHVFMSLTNERSDDDSNFFSEPNSRTTAEGLPLGREAHYEVAVFDTGAPATIINYQAFLDFGIREAGRDGTNITGLGGVGETIDAINSDPLGVYAVGFDGLLTNPRTGEQAIDRAQLKGTFNDSIIYAPPGSNVNFNLIGTTTAQHYTTSINWGDPRILEFDGERHRSPALTLHEIDGIAAPSRRIGMDLIANETLPLPAFFPDVGNFNLDDIGDNPSVPTIASSMWVTANVSNNGFSRNQLDAIFDTGAQASFVSEQIAAEMGFDVVNDEPDFVVRIAGVTGASEEVPGFYADEISLPGTDGGLVLKNVPLVVFDLTDPTNAPNTLDALIGMNLFAGRNMVLHPGGGSRGPYLGVSDHAQPFHAWNSDSATAEWGDRNSWTDPADPAIDWYTNVYNKTGTPQVALVTEDSTIGALVMKGHEELEAGTMTVSIEDGVTLTTFASSIIQEGAVVQLNNGTIDPLAVEIRGGTVSGTGTVMGEVLSQGDLIPGGNDGIGTLTFPGSLDQLADGTLKIELGDNSDRSDLQHDRLLVEGAMSIAGRLEVFTTDDYVQPEPGSSDRFTIVRAENGLIGEIDEYFFDGVELERDFPLASDPRAFRDHIEDGQFISVSYLNLNSFSLRNYQAVPGDANGDGEVAIDDFLELSRNFNRDGLDWTGGDFNGDGAVTVSDFLDLSKNFGTVARAAAVPEPSTSLLGTLSLGALLLLRRRRR